MKIVLKGAALVLMSSLSLHAWGPSLWHQLIGLDLGTRNSIVVTNEGGKVEIRSNTPSAVCYHRDSGDLICVGQAALKKIGKCPEGVVAVRPLKDGVIDELEPTSVLLRAMLQSAQIKLGTLTKTRMVIGIPCSVKAGDWVAIRECARGLGVSEVLLVKEPIAAAIDAGLPIGSDSVHMVVDIGGGTSDIIAIAQYGLLAKRAIPIACDKFDEALADSVRKTFHLSIDEETAQEVKSAIGAVYLDDNDEDKNKKIEISGIDLLQQIPRKVTISTRDVVKALEPSVDKILDAVHGVMRQLKQRAAGDIAKNGILLVGGGAMLPGMKEKIEQRFGIPVTVPNEPLLSVARGIGKILGDFETYEKVLNRTNSFKN